MRFRNRKSSLQNKIVEKTKCTKPDFSSSNLIHSIFYPQFEFYNSKKAFLPSTF